MLATKIPEQRKHKRFETPNAIVVTPGNVCRIINIRSGGLSFKCYLAIDFPTKWSLDIIIAASNFQLTQLPVELVWKTPADQSSLLFIPAGNAGVKFDDLHQSQEEMLDYLLSQLWKTGPLLREGSACFCFRMKDYMHPEPYGQSKEKSIKGTPDPKGMQRMKEKREKR